MQFFQKNHGVITVFVTLIMVPVVIFTGTFVDVARLKFCSSQAAMAADSYGEVVLSQYDNLLKELYGLFSVTQNEEGLAAIEELGKYVPYSFNPAGEEGSDLNGFMPYAETAVEVSYEEIEGASLSNSNVLLTQISEFMQFRIIKEVIDEAGILKSIEQFSKVDGDMDAMDSITKISTKGSKALEKINVYYEILDKISDYPNYIERLRDNYTGYAGALKEMCDEEEYEKYFEYLKNKEEIDDVVEKKKQIDEMMKEEVSENEENLENEEDSEEEESLIETMSEEELELAEKYMSEEEIEDYIDKKESVLYGAELIARNYNRINEEIDFYNTEELIKELADATDDVISAITEINEQLQKLQEQLPKCSEEVREGIEEEIRDLEKIMEMEQDFQETYDLIKGNIQKNEDNEEFIEKELDKLNKIRDKLIAGEVIPETAFQTETEALEWAWIISFDWYDFMDKKEVFYNELKEICTTNADVKKGKKAADKKINAAKDETKAAEDEINKDEESEARDISPVLASALNVQESSDIELEKVTEYFSDGLSVEGVLNSVVDRFLLAAYDFGMFSSRVTGIEEPEEDSEIGEVPDSETTENGTQENVPSKDADSEEEYADYSLTNIKMSKDVNYLYGAELEYLFGGHNNSDDNLNETRNIICGVRLTLNFASTYMIKDLNTAIQNVANAIASVSGPAAPLIRVAVSGALRMAIATMETAEDWKQLKARESVILIKNNMDELQCIEKIEALIGEGKIEETEKKESLNIQLSYEDYLYILMYLCVDTDTLLSRTSTLITLNVNQSKNDGDELSTLDFKMADTVTAIESMCKVKMDFVIVPDNFMEMYLKNTSGNKIAVMSEDTKTIIQRVENEYIGYSVIRGY